MSKKDESKIKGELGKAELEALKNANPGLRSVFFEHDETGEKAVVYMKKPSREIFSQGNKISETKDELTTAEFLLKNLRVGGMDDKEVIADIDWLKNFTVTAIQLLWVKRGEIKKN